MFGVGWAGDGGVRFYALQTGVAPQVPKRGKIHGFSRAARRRLTDKLMAVPWNDICATRKHARASRGVLLTLTYPGTGSPDWERSKEHLDNFRRQLFRTAAQPIGAIWRMEYQRRGAIHYHILVTAERPLNCKRLETWARKTWFRIVGSGDVRHLEHGVDVVPLYQNKCSKGRLLRYLIKYLGKTDAGDRFGGRVWGGWGQLHQEIRYGVSIETEQAWFEIQRRIRRWGKKSRYLRKLANRKGVRLFGDGGPLLRALCRGLPGVTVYEV